MDQKEKTYLGHAKKTGKKNVQSGFVRWRHAWKKTSE